MAATVADTSYPGIDDPEIRNLRDAPGMPRGQRADTVLLILNAAGNSGWSNHQILALGSELLDRWDKFPSSNLYEHWSRLLGMLHNVRSHYPSPEIPHARTVSGPPPS